jgi:AbrB family looped-hinge helix DNA binding protein
MEVRLMLKVTISQKGQISLPAVLRKRYDLKRGDKLIVEEKEGSIMLRPLPKHPLLDLRGKYSSKEKKKLTEILLEERKADKKREKQ